MNNWGMLFTFGIPALIVFAMIIAAIREEIIKKAEKRGDANGERGKNA